VPAHQVIEDSDFMSFTGKIERLGPAEIAITAKNENTHCSSIIGIVAV
jgi:hypothetical protein